jgi:hypothetical protein
MAYSLGALDGKECGGRLRETAAVVLRGPPHTVDLGLEPSIARFAKLGGKPWAELQ